VGKHSLYADKFTQLFYLLIQLVWAANYGRWCRWWVHSDPTLIVSQNSKKSVSENKTIVQQIQIATKNCNALLLYRRC